jgi:hypothetical protein
MSELKRNADFASAGKTASATPSAAGIDDSQPWHTADMQQAMERWNAAADAGFDPYNHVGTLAKKTRAA